MKNLTIMIAGQTASGRSRLTYLLKGFLRENGFDVEQTPSLDHSTEASFDNAMGKDIDVVINNLKEVAKITIKEMQLPANNTGLSQVTYVKLDEPN